METRNRDCHFFLYIQDKWLMYKKKKKKSLEINKKQKRERKGKD